MKIDLNYHLLGQRLRAIRKKQKLTQEQVAELANISSQHFSGIETGSAKVSLPTLVRLCNALNTTPNDILMDSVTQSTPLLLQDVAEVFENCTPDEVYLMLSQARSLKKALRLKNAGAKDIESLRHPCTKTGQRPLYTICLQIFRHNAQLSLVKSQDHKWSD